MRGGHWLETPFLSHHQPGTHLHNSPQSRSGACVCVCVEGEDKSTQLVTHCTRMYTHMYTYTQLQMCTHIHTYTCTHTALWLYTITGATSTQPQEDV